MPTSQAPASTSSASSVDPDMDRMLAGYGLTTAEILYRMPDQQSLLQTFLWQEYDLAPKFPELRKFLKFWEDELDGPLHSVRYNHQRLIAPGEWRNASGLIQLH